MAYRYKSAGCDPAAMPRPDGTCAKIMGGQPITAAMREQMWQDACQQRAKVYGSVDGDTACPKLGKPFASRPSGCNDPRAICAPEQTVTATPLTSVKKPPNVTRAPSGKPGTEGPPKGITPPSPPGPLPIPVK
jgi:hypothetical protein